MSLNKPELERLSDEYSSKKGPACTGLPEFGEEAADLLDIDTTLGRSFGEYIRSTYGSTRVGRDTIANLTLKTLDSLGRITPDTLVRANHFMYIPLDKTAPMTVQFSRLARNAEYMSNIFGVNMFTTSGKETSYYRARIGDGFSLTAKGGSGSGAFALDLAIESDRWSDDRDRLQPSHELWRVGLDTANIKEADEAAKPDVMRIIRTGGAIKANDEKKQREFNRFRRAMNTTPQRVLTFTAAHVMQGLNFNTTLALSTKGATELSSLSKSASATPTRYSELHRDAGFTDQYSEHWLMASNIQKTFFDKFVAKTPETAGMQPQEYRAVDLAITAFNALVNISDNPFPIKICQETDKSTLEAALKAYMR